MHHHTEKVSRKRVVDRIMHFYEKGVKQFWEVYAGQSNLSRAMSALGYEVTTFDLNAGWNFEKAHHRREFFKLFRKVCPGFVWLAPPCTVWSPLQSLTPRSDEQLHALQCERDYQEHVHLKFTGRVFQEQLDEGRDSAVEQPDLALSWRTPTFQKLLAKGYRSRLDQCAYGAKLPDEHGNLTYIRKPTSLCPTSSTLAQDLSRTCPGGHRHLPIEGSSPGIGNRAKASATYQPSMCKQLAISIDNYLNTKHFENTYTTTDTPAPVQHQPSSSPQPDSPPPQHADVPDPPPEPEQSQPTQRGILHRLSPTTNLEANRTIQRLHRNLGHPTMAQLEKLLIERKANERPRPGPKISWKGPATVVMIEREPHEVLWLVHGTTMLRASPEHVKPVLSPETSTTTITMEQPLNRAQQSLQQIRNRGVTQYVDLSKTNKRTREEVETEDEMD